jgi:hypothetical protein
MLFLPTLLKAAGAGIGLLGQFGSANRYDEMAEIRYGIDRANAGVRRQQDMTALRLQAAGNRLELSSARMNLQLALADADSRKRNAERLRLFAEARTKQGRKAIRRRMGEFDEFRSSETAAVGASGVAFSGSALEVMAENEYQMRTDLQDMNDAIAFERGETLMRAGIEEAGANLDRAGARAQFGLAKAGAKLSQTAVKIGRLSSQTAFQNALQQAEFSRLEGRSAATGTRLGAAGSILSGVGGFMTDRYNIRRNGL